MRIAEILRIGTSVSNVTPTIPSSCSQIFATWDSGIEVDVKCLSRPSVSGLTGIVGAPENVCGPEVWRETLTDQSGGVTLLSKKAPGLPSLSPPEPYDGSSETRPGFGETKCDEYFACMLAFLGSPDFWTRPLTIVPFSEYALRAASTTSP